MFHKPSLIIIPALFLIALLAGPLCAQIPVPGAPEIVSVNIDKEYDKLLSPQSRGWLGGDGAISVPLSAEKTLWVFGDSPLGTISEDGARKGPMIRNCIAIQDIGKSNSDKVEFFWDLTDRLPGDFFHPDSFTDSHWYWPGTGTVVDGELYLFLAKITAGDDFMFKTIGLTLFHVLNPLDPPEQWNITKTDIASANDHRAFCSGIYFEKPYIYLLGHDDGPENSPAMRTMVLARLKVKDIKSGKKEEAFEYWSRGRKWNNNPDTLLPLFSKGSTESSLHYDPLRKLYFSVVLQPYTSDIFLLSAPRLTGPWSAPVNIYTIPELAKNENYLAYAGKAHPELARDNNEIIITYVVNTSDFWSMFSDLDIYYPRFIRVQLKSMECK